MSPHTLTSFQIQKYYQNEPRFNAVYSRDNLSKIKDEPYLINLDGYSNIRTHWIALYSLNNDSTYFDIFGEYKYFQNTSMWFNNVWIFLYWIHQFYACK